MVAAGLFGTSGPVLIGQALFVYFRGAIVFYAVRALNPSWARFSRCCGRPAAFVGDLDVLVALVQMVVGRPAYRGVGWVDPTWADIHRAQGLFDHPNHLGHVLGLVLIGWSPGWSACHEGPPEVVGRVRRGRARAWPRPSPASRWWPP